MLGFYVYVCRRHDVIACVKQKQFRIVCAIQGLCIQNTRFVVAEANQMPK